jgi:polyisoprenoid-binding protein YceI
MHHVTGVSRDFLCQVDLSPDTVSSRIKVSAAVSSFDSRNSSRDSHAMEMVEAMKYPKVEFSSEAVKPEGDGYLVSGNLTFHGITRPVSFHVSPKSAGGKVEIIGEFAVKLSDYKVKRPTLLFVPTQDKLTIRFDLFANP